MHSDTAEEEGPSAETTLLAFNTGNGLLCDQVKYLGCLGGSECSHYRRVLSQVVGLGGVCPARTEKLSFGDFELCSTSALTVRFTDMV